MQIDLKNEEGKTMSMSMPPPPTFIAQFVPQHSEQLTLPTPHMLSLHSHVVIPYGHPLVLELNATHFYTKKKNSFTQFVSAFLIGQALPFRIHVVPDRDGSTNSGSEGYSSLHCSLETSSRIKTEFKGNGAPPEEHLPLLLAVDSLQGQGTSDGAILGDTVRRGAEGLPVWHPAVTHRQILLISDPRCQYHLK